LRRFIAKLFCAAACAVALFGAPAVRAQDELKIAAIVNDDVITQLDVYMRLRLAMLSAKLQDTPDTRQRMLPTVVRALIEDRLKLQEAKAQGIGVSEPEVNTRIDNLARRNGATRAEFEAMLESNGVLITALADEIRADIAWARLVQRDLRPKIRITDEEIDEAMARLTEARQALADGDREALLRLQSEAATERQALLEAQLGGGEQRELRVMVPNRPGVIAKLALDLGRAGINISDMTLSPLDAHQGEVTLWVDERDAGRASSLLDAL